MLKRVCAIALTVAMLLSMVCTFSVASAAEPMSLRVELNKDVVQRGDKVVVTITVENYVPCAGLGIVGTFDADVFDAKNVDVAVETTPFADGAVNPAFGGYGKFYFNLANSENVAMNASFKLATVTLPLNNDRTFDESDITVGFNANDMTVVDGGVSVDMPVDDFSAAAVEKTVALEEIAAADKMEITVSAKDTVVRGEVFEAIVAVKNYMPLASYSFDLGYNKNVLDLVEVTPLLGANASHAVYDKVWPDQGNVRVMEIATDAANIGTAADEAVLAKVTFKVRKDADLVSADLTAKFVENDGVDSAALGYQLADGNFVEMIPGYEFVSKTATAATAVVANDKMMSLTVSASADKADRGDEVVLNLGLENAVPFAGITVDIPLDAAVFEIADAETATGAYIDADIMTLDDGRKVARVILANSANMEDVTALATVTLKVKADAKFAKTELKDAYIKQAVVINAVTESLVEGADYTFVANLLTVEIACDHDPEGYVYTSNDDGTHDITCSVDDCDYLVEGVACSDADPFKHDPTCTEDGYFENVCICGHTWNVPSNEGKLDHDLSYKHVEGTVATAAKHVATCSRGDYTEEVACTFNEVVSPASCLKNETVVATCTGCGYSYNYEKLNTKTAHGKDKIRYYAATETVAGKWAYFCNTCQTWATEEAIPAGHPFPDVKKPTSWFYDGVQYAKAINVVSGDDKGNFNPNNNITRAEVATILVRYLGYEAEYKDLSAVDFETYLTNLYAKTGVEKKTLSDLKSDKWFYRATSVACALGIFKGDDNNKFNPNKNISRQEFCLVLYRLYKDAGLKIDTAKTYADIAKVPSWSKEAVLWAASVGLFNGDDKGNFNPTQNATRAQIAVLMMRIDVDIRNVEVM